MDIIQEINNKYVSMEAEVDNKLEILNREEAKIEQSSAAQRQNEGIEESGPPKELNFTEALNRNSAILKSLERTKARLRSRSTFTPLEEILEKALVAYQKSILGTDTNHQEKEENL